MPNAEIRVTYAELEHAQRQLDQLEEQVEEIRRSLTQRREALNGQWIGFGAEAFMREMDDEILPAIGRLAAALTHTEAILTHSAEQLSESEITESAQIKALDATTSGPSPSTPQTGIETGSTAGSDQPTGSSTPVGSGVGVGAAPVTGSASPTTSAGNSGDQTTGSSSSGNKSSDAGTPFQSESPSVQAAPSYIGSIPNSELEEKLLEEYSQIQAAGATGPTPILIFDDPSVEAVTPINEPTIPEELSKREIPIHGTPTEPSSFTTANGESISIEDFGSTDQPTAEPTVTAVEGKPITPPDLGPQAGKGQIPDPILIHDES